MKTLHSQPNAFEATFVTMADFFWFRMQCFRELGQREGIFYNYPLSFICTMAKLIELIVHKRSPKFNTGEVVEPEKLSSFL